MKAFKKTAAARAVSAITAAVLTSLIMASQAGLAWHYADQPSGQTAINQTTRTVPTVHPERSPVSPKNLASEPFVPDPVHNS